MQIPNFLDDKKRALLQDVGLLFLRLSFGGTLLAAHGWRKLTNFGSLSESFSDPLGIGSTLSLMGTIGAEVFCSLAIIIGLFTRLTVLPLIFTMGVAGFIYHAADPFQKKELAFVYLFAFIVVLLCGPGRFSVDKLIFKK